MRLIQNVLGLLALTYITDAFILFCTTRQAVFANSTCSLIPHRYLDREQSSPFQWQPSPYRLNEAEFHYIDPTNPSSLTLVHTFPNTAGLLGIAETSPDSFIVAAGKLCAPDLMSMRKIDFNYGRTPEILKLKELQKPG